jgi:hypothetical protein
LSGTPSPLHAKVGLNRVRTPVRPIVVEPVADVPDGRRPRGDFAGQRGAQSLGDGDGAVVMPISRARARGVPLDEIRRAEVSGFRLLAHHLREQQVAVVREAPLHAAAPANPDPDAAREVGGIELAEDLLRGPWLDRRFEVLAQPLFGEAGDRDAPQPLLARVDEYEVVAPAGVRPRRRYVLRERIVMKLLVDDDPHVDLVAPHHREQHLVARFEPPFADGELLRPGQQGLRVGDRRASDDRGDQGCGEQDS